jgi:hypothetical protein
VTGLSAERRETISTEEAGGKRDGAAALNGGRQAGLDTEAEIKPRQAESSGGPVGGEQHVGQHGMGRTGRHGSADQLEAGTEFSLGADQLHRFETRGRLSCPWLHHGFTWPADLQRHGDVIAPLINPAFRSTTLNGLSLKKEKLIQ